MKNNIILFFFCLLASLQSFAAEWSIGIYEGASPLELAPIPSTPSPVLSAQDVVDIPAEFVADPFLLPVDDTWHMFVEILNTATNQGDIGHATSDNGLDWTYQQIVLDEPHHLSYPYVFEWQGDYYMVPESHQLNSIVLYRAVNFPMDWEFLATLVTGLQYVDPSPFFYNDIWWMFAGSGLNDTLHLFYADELTGPWVEHPGSPLVVSDGNIARPGGRVLQFDGRLLRITQDDAPTYGNQVRAFEITTLSKVDYAEFEVPESPLLSATSSGWNAVGMHHIDALRLPSGRWLAAVDGMGDPAEYQGTGIGKDNWTLWFVDSEELVGENGAAINAFDGNGDTLWHTEWSQTSPPPPHEIQLFLGSAYDIDGFRYAPRQDGGINGRIGDYEFYVSSDGVDWGAPLASGSFADDADIKEIRFAPVTGQFVRLRALSEVNGNDWTSMAELDVFGVSAGNINLPPNGVIDTPALNVTINAGGSVDFSATGTDINGDLPLSYLWRFAAGSGVADSTLEDPGPIQFNNVGTFTVTLTVTDNQGLADPTPATRTITVLDNPVGLPISQNNWSLWFVDSEELIGEDGAASNAFDGNTATIWHTEWSRADPPPPHDIQLFLGDAYDIDGFHYVPRQDGSPNGRIADYEFFVSSDGINWGLPVTSGTFANTASTKEIRFAPVTGQFVRLRALSEVNGNDWTSAAEIEVLGIPAAGGTNLPPNGVIDTPTFNVAINAGESIDFSATGSDIDGDLPLSQLWQFGAGSGVADSTLEDPGLVQFNNAGTFTVTLTVTDAQGLADPTPATRTITVLDNPVGVPISQNNWSLWFVDSEELIGEDGAASNAFDGNTATIWHTEWSQADPPPPHDIQLFLGDAYDIDGFRYVPRQDGSPNGRIGSYQFFVSSDGVNWGLPVISGTFANTASAKEIRFTPVTGQFVQLRALSEVNGNPWTSAAEIAVLGIPAAGGINLAPNGVIDTPAQNLSINVGESVNFTGTGSDIDGDLPLSYLWRFDAGSGVVDSTLEDPGLVQFNNAGTFTVTLTVTDAQGLADPTPATRTITVLDNPVGLPISQNNWSLRFFDSQELIGENGAASNAFDGNTATIWHTEWLQADPPPPHDIQLFLGAAYDIDGFRYVPRQDGGINGRIADYQFYVSSDGADWGAPVASGTFANNASVKEIRFPPVTAQFVRLRALSEVNGNPWTSLAELEVLGVPAAGGTNLPPVATGNCNTTPQEQVLVGSLNATDPETPALLFYTLGADGSGGLGPIITAKGGTVVITDATTGAFTYQPASSGARGTDSFGYQVSDPDGGRDSATETVVVDEKIMPLGDSITAGETGSPLLPADTVGYRKPLYDLLTAAGLRFDFVGSRSEGSGVPGFDFNHEGHPAWTAFDIAFGLTGFPTDGVRAWLDANPADIVLLHAGTNELNSTNELDIADILDEIDQWEASPGGNPVTVLLALIIDQDPINPLVTTFNTDVQAMAQARILAGDSIIIVDQHSALSYPADLNDPLHPNDSGYGNMADTWFTPLSPVIDACP